MKDIEESRKMGKRRKGGAGDDEDDTEQSFGVRKRVHKKGKGKGKRS